MPWSALARIGARRTMQTGMSIFSKARLAKALAAEPQMELACLGRSPYLDVLYKRHLIQLRYIMDRNFHFTTILHDPASLYLQKDCSFYRKYEGAWYLFIPWPKFIGEFAIASPEEMGFQSGSDTAWMLESYDKPGDRGPSRSYLVTRLTELEELNLVLIKFGATKSLANQMTILSPHYLNSVDDTLLIEKSYEFSYSGMLNATIIGKNMSGNSIILLGSCLSSLMVIPF